MRRRVRSGVWPALGLIALSWSAAHPAVGQETGRVSALDNSFAPAALTVDVGATVVWTNAGQNPHTVTADDRSFDSGTLEPGQTFSVTFDQEGRFPYYCQIHGEPGSGMVGAVVVQGVPAQEPAPQPSESEGLARTGLDPVPLVLAALGLAAAGLAVLRSARRATAEGRSQSTWSHEGRRKG